MAQTPKAARNGGKSKRAQANRPFHELRSANLKAVVWENGTKHGPMFSAVLVRVWRDDAGDWHETHSLGRDDLLLAAKLLDQAHTIVMREESRRAAQTRRQAGDGDDGDRKAA